ncbi:adenylyltransferase [Variovorax paradoxus]|jgi:streptomycin 3"-adenylyltransferase|nr:adenylyltransferase [Variovorax paradoxus]KPV05219.1 adenylyltransferase [Variovorax paradoxus]KPV09250.1 adenylyltransferase [Variovorax paradoxus]KPV19293.1 adenylyltransferase [Variovorax paradoxus]KPV28983.1 adenylyltransferase [Variovorax paradoxus]
MTALLPIDIAPQLSLSRVVLERHLPGRIESLHLFGSAVDGGLQPESDIDLLVCVAAPLTAATRQALMTDLLSVSAPPGTDAALRPLEVTIVVHDEVLPWRYPARRELQFGEWLRDALKAGIFDAPEIDRDLAILLTKARQHSVALIGPAAEALFDPVPASDFAQALHDTIGIWNEPADWDGDERNVVLALARIWFSAATGGIASKDAAAAWVIERLPDELRPLMARAREAYLGQAVDDLASRQGEVAAFVAYAKQAVERALGLRASSGASSAQD